MASNYLSGILASERKEKKKPFRKVFVYKDEHWVNPTTLTLTNSPIGLTGPVALLANKYRSYQNFASGLAILQTTKPNAAGRELDKEFEAIAAMDLDSFVASFGESEAFADALVTRSQQVVQEWTQDNAYKEKVGVRVPIERAYKLSQHTWRGRKKQEFSQYDLQLSSWGFNQKNLHKEIPDKMFLSDVKVLLKLRSTSGVIDSPDCSGLIEGSYKYDGYGYGVPCTHFFGLLRAPGFKRAVEEARKYRSREPPGAKKNASGTLTCAGAGGSTVGTTTSGTGKKRKAAAASEAAGGSGGGGGKIAAGSVQYATGAPTAFNLNQQGQDEEEEEETEEEEEIGGERGGPLVVNYGGSSGGGGGGGGGGSKSAA